MTGEGGGDDGVGGGREIVEAAGDSITQARALSVSTEQPIVAQARAQSDLKRSTEKEQGDVRWRRGGGGGVGHVATSRRGEGGAGGDGESEGEGGGGGGGGMEAFEGLKAINASVCAITFAISKVAEGFRAAGARGISRSGRQGGYGAKGRKRGSVGQSLRECRRRFECFLSPHAPWERVLVSQGLVQSEHLCKAIAARVRVALVAEAEVQDAVACWSLLMCC